MSGRTATGGYSDSHTKAETKEYFDKFCELTAKGINAQAKHFLHAFVLEFQGNFEEILDLAGQFGKCAGDDRELEEMEAHRFLEKRNETVTVKKLRDWLHNIDLDKNHKISFIEYLLYKYEKTIEQLFAPPAAFEKRPSPEALALLDEAIDKYQGIVAYKAACEKKMEGFNKVIEEGKASDAKGKQKIAAADAGKELSELQGAMQIKLQKDKMNAKGAKKRAQQAVEDSMRDCDPIKQEEERVAKFKKEKEEAQAKAKAESKAKLAARAAMFEGK